MSASAGYETCADCCGDKVVHWYMDRPGTHVTRAFHAQEKSSIGTSKAMKNDKKNDPFKALRLRQTRKSRPLVHRCTWSSRYTRILWTRKVVHRYAGHLQCLLRTGAEVIGKRPCDFEAGSRVEIFNFPRMNNGGNLDIPRIRGISNIPRPIGPSAAIAIFSQDANFPRI